MLGLKGLTTHSTNMVLLKNKYGYIFDPETMYQPALPNIEYFDHGRCRFFPDGSVETLDTDWELANDSFRGWNTYNQAGSGFRAYVVAANHFWPHRPSELKAIDHINRDRSDDSWGNLRFCSTSLNNLNQYRRNVKGYRYETSEWLEKVNACRARAGKPAIRLRGPPRNKYIAMLTYRGESVELGEFDTPEEATQCYVAAKEPFIQEQLRSIWTAFLSP